MQDELLPGIGESKLYDFGQGFATGMVAAVDPL